ncbi:hypothetical protein AQ883_21070 [Burkholderia pseudomallei]|nr:hypothetical protein AQ864_06195 [Burkholderia pseudomallei]OMZ48522.1 hypothetical protein AQ863_03030 [Burkholderia pseudomallei]OMZ57550.1 hypothetical protein AQ866_14465 [Burkholderia pseudomallei]OMZ62670.1 hypothetical protein AQ867_16195 [Burkholderia pseudomallei]OMZ80634.1 hypothetical protein AQ869_13140 [Burkholderia pseudomallei]
MAAVPHERSISASEARTAIEARGRRANDGSLRSGYAQAERNRAPARRRQALGRERGAGGPRLWRMAAAGFAAVAGIAPAHRSRPASRATESPSAKRRAALSSSARGPQPGGSSEEVGAFSARVPRFEPIDASEEFAHLAFERRVLVEALPDRIEPEPPICGIAYRRMMDEFLSRFLEDPDCHLEMGQFARDITMPVHCRTLRSCSPRSC